MSYNAVNREVSVTKSEVIFLNSMSLNRNSHYVLIGWQKCHDQSRGFQKHNPVFILGAMVQYLWQFYRTQLL